MATDITRAYLNGGKHNVGVINSISVNSIPHGAVAKEDMDNFILAELDGHTEGGDLQCKPLADGKNAAYLVATPVQRLLGEDLGHTFNGEGDKANLVLLVAGYTRFQCSNFKAAAGVDAVEKGMVAHFDPKTKEYIVSKADAPAEGFADAGTQFMVVADEADVAGQFAVPTIRLMATKTVY